MFGVDRVKVLVNGNVQDVGYRMFCIETASGMEITGYAENIYDGSVEVVAEGNKGKLEAFLEKIKNFEINYSSGKVKGVESFEIVKREKSLKRKYEGFKGLGTSGW